LKGKTVLILDLDNTVIDYDHSHELALEKVLHQFHFSVDDYDRARHEVKAIVRGVNHYQKALYFKRMVENSKRPYSQVIYMNDTYDSVFHKNLRVDSSIKNLILTASKRSIKTVLLTNFNALDQIRKLAVARLDQSFDHIISSQDLDIEKPNPLMFYEALRRTGAAPADAIMIGDSRVDVATQIGIDSYPYTCSSVSFGISGKSGSGKTTLSYLIKEVFDQTLVICGDSYHRWERNSEMWKTLTSYNPEANDLEKQDSDVQKLFYNESILLREYNHVSGQFSNEYPINKKKTLVVEGLHTFVNQDKYFTFTIFVNNTLADDLKMKRDVAYRGKTAEEVLKSIESRTKDYTQFIEPQREKAGIVLDIFENHLSFKFNADRFQMTKIENVLNRSASDIEEHSYVFSYSYSSMTEYREVILNLLSKLKKGMYE